MGNPRLRESIIEDVQSASRLRVRNRRALVRLVMNVPAVVEWAGLRHPGVVTDLAHGGAFVECDTKPDVATHVLVSVTVGTELARFEGVVRWIGEGGVGIQFTGLGEAEAHAVGVLCSRRVPGL